MSKVESAILKLLFPSENFEFQEKMDKVVIPGKISAWCLSPTPSFCDHSKFKLIYNTKTLSHDLQLFWRTAPFPPVNFFLQTKGPTNSIILPYEHWVSMSNVCCQFLCHFTLSARFSRYRQKLHLIKICPFSFVIHWGTLALSDFSFLARSWVIGGESVLYF